MRINFNNGWQFTPNFTDDFLSGLGDSTPVRLPHTTRELPLHYFDEHDYQMVCGYRHTLFVPEDWRGKRVFLHFAGVAHLSTVYLNGIEVGTHRCGYTSFDVELTHWLNYGLENTVTLRVDSRESSPVPPFGFVIDYMTFGGIYREAWIDVKPNSFIADTFVSTEGDSVSCRVTLAQDADCPFDALSCQVFSCKGDMLYSELFHIPQLSEGDLPIPNCLGVDPDQCVSFQLTFPAPGLELWSPDAPNLYTLECTLLHGETALDTVSTRFARRTAQFKSDGFYLNGHPLKLRGLNRHQSYPRIGYAAPASMQRMDADILKYELGCNAVRTSHYPQSQHFLDRCDELGLLVFTEIPGWQHIGGEDWQDQAVENLEEMVVQYRNHPSIVLWGVRINESLDNDALYTRTNQLCRSLDPTRATGGVRCIERSQLLEDVYTYNDFCQTSEHGGLRPRKEIVRPENRSAPYLVSENNGHMFPTKPFDDERHRLSHALRHTGVINGLYQRPEIAGEFGWCMFDYNTHQEFGSGDRVCYHGVLDLFRNPKLAAAVYASQSDRTDICVISSTMDIGEHPAGNLNRVYAFTNADSVKLYKNGQFIREFFPDRTAWPAMPHPPVCIDDFVGDLLETREGLSHKFATELKELFRSISEYGINDLPPKVTAKATRLLAANRMTMEQAIALYGKYIGNWGGGSISYRFEAIRGGQAVQIIEKAPVTSIHLEAIADHTDLVDGDCYDMALIRLRVADQLGNVLPYYQEPVLIKQEGPVEVVGPQVLATSAGYAGCFVRTTGVPGQACLTFATEQCDPVTIDFTVSILEQRKERF